MTTTTRDTFGINALPVPLLASVRDTQRDASGNPPVHVVAGGGEPLRCCLRNADPGEALMLFGYEPPLPPMPPSPYRELGAIFAHAEPCAGPDASSGYPADWRTKPQVLRAYDERGWIHDAVLHDGTGAEAAIRGLLADPCVVQIHSRNVAYGCFMFTITRAAAPA